MYSTQLERPKEIINRPQNAFMNEFVAEIETMEEYKNAESFRSQCYFLIEKSREYYAGKYKLRYYCKWEDIDFYYAMLTAYFLLYDIPPYFLFNVDEEGHDEFADSKKKKKKKKKDLIVVPIEWEKKRIPFPYT